MENFQFTILSFTLQIVSLPDGHSKNSRYYSRASRPQARCRFQASATWQDRPGSNLIHVMTENYDNDDLHHRAIRLGIEQGNGISNMEKISVALDAMKKAGFVLEVSEDLADRNDELPWYWPLSGDLRYTQSLWGLPTLIRMTHVGRGLAHGIVGALKMIGFAPKG